jgi:hypothetical protein
MQKRRNLFGHTTFAHTALPYFAADLLVHGITVTRVLCALAVAADFQLLVELLRSGTSVGPLASGKLCSSRLPLDAEDRSWAIPTAIEDKKAAAQVMALNTINTALLCALMWAIPSDVSCHKWQSGALRARTRKCSELLSGMRWSASRSLSFVKPHQSIIPLSPLFVTPDRKCIAL